MFIKGGPCSCVNFPSSLFRYVFSESMTAMCGFFCISGVYPSPVSMVTLVIVYAYQSTSSTVQSFHPFPNFHDTQHRLGASLVVAVLNVSHNDIIILPTPPLYSISKKYLCRFYYSISQKVITLSGRRFITVSGVLLHYRAVITLSGVFFTLSGSYYSIGRLLHYRLVQLSLTCVFLAIGNGSSFSVMSHRRASVTSHRSLDPCLRIILGRSSSYCLARWV